MGFSLESKYINFSFGKHQGGSGKSIFSTGRRNSVRINPTDARGIYDIYANYPITYRIINDITDAIKNTPIWISNRGGEINNLSARTFKKLIESPNRNKKSGNFAADIAFEMITFGRCFIIKRKYGAIGDEYFILRNTDIISIQYENANFSEKAITKIDYREFTKNGYYENKSIEESESSNIFRLDLAFQDPGDFSGNYQYGTFKCPIVAVRSEIQAYANMVNALDENYGDGGARKIVSFKESKDTSYGFAKTQLPQQEEDLHEKLSEEYGRNSGDRKYIISQYDTSVNDLSLPTNQLDVPQTKPQLENSICMPFKYPPQLLGVKSGAYKSQTEAEAAFYIRCVSPLANEIFKNLNRIFGTNIDGTIELDYSVYEFFQIAKQAKGTAMQTFMQGAIPALTNGIVTKEELRKIILDMM